MHTIAIIATAAVCLAACASSPAGAGGTVLFEGAIPTVSGPPLVPPSIGITQDPPGGGGPAYFWSDAKTPLETGTVEIKFSRSRFVSIRGLDYLAFELMVDNIALLNDVTGFFPRLYFGTGDRDFVQFRNTPEIRDILAAGQEAGQWFTVRVPVTEVTIHAFEQNYSASKNSLCAVMFRFICITKDEIPGTWYVRNIRFEN